MYKKPVCIFHGINFFRDKIVPWLRGSVKDIQRRLVPHAWTIDLAASYISRLLQAFSYIAVT